MVTELRIYKEPTKMIDCAAYATIGISLPRKNMSCHLQRLAACG